MVTPCQDLSDMLLPPLDAARQDLMDAPLVLHIHGRRRLQQYGQRWRQLRKVSVRPFRDALLLEQGQPAADR